MTPAYQVEQVPQRRPNILLVMADQWAAASLGAYGCDVPGVSPHLDALAARGVTFERHYTPIPLCGPSRSALFSGMSPQTSGVVGNDVEPRPGTPFLPRLLRDGGYRTAGVGKFHFTPHSNYPPTDLSHLGFDRVEVTEDTKHGAWLDWVASAHPEHYERAFATAWPMPYLRSLPPDGRDGSEDWERARRTHLDPLRVPPYRRIFHPSPLPAEVHQTAWITDRAIAQLDEAADVGEPFFHYVSYVDPHDPYDPPAEWASRYDWQTMPPPVPQEWSRADGPWQYAAFQDSKFEIASFDAEAWARLRAAFYASCSFVDDQVGRLLGRLRETGQERETLVLFTTDHGDMVGDHGLLMKGPWHYDRTIRCPMVVAGPGAASGRRFPGLTSHLDVMPSLLKAARVQPPACEGRPLPLSEAELTTDPGHARLVVETNTSYVAPADPVRTLLTDDGWRLTIFPGQAYGELFDLRADPDEQHNRWRDTDCLHHRLSMTEQLVAAMAEPAVLGRRGST